MMRLAFGAIAFLLAASPFALQVTDQRGKKPGGVMVEASEPDADDWHRLRVTKSKGDSVLIWPFDAKAAAPQGPEPVPVTVVTKGDPKILSSPKVVAMLAVPVLLQAKTLAESAQAVGVQPSALETAVLALRTSEDGFEKGIALLWAKKPGDATDELARGLRARERVMTRIPSEIYPAAMLQGKALFNAGKFEDAALAFLKAVKLRPSDAAAREQRAAALRKAGKPEAAEETLRRR